jgi:Terminase large subunit, T4likevirus-type, N-terminal
MPFLPGQSGNPHGRPIGSTSVKAKVQQALLDVLEKPDPTKPTQNNFTSILEKWLTDCRNGEPYAVRLMVDRLFQPELLADIDRILQAEKRENTDLLTYRILNSSHDKQQSLLLTKEKLILIMAGRRSGKTHGLARLYVKTMLETDKAVCLYLGKTVTVAVEQMFNPVMDLLHFLGIECEQSSRNEGIIRIDRGSELHIRGNSSKEERAKLRGFKWHLAGVDEAQDQGFLEILLPEIIEPALMDVGGTLLLAGTGPRIAGTRWQEMWENKEKYKAFRINFDIRDNCYIKDHLAALQEVLRTHNWKESNSTFQREYLGLPVLDVDAMVYRLSGDPIKGGGNYFTDDELMKWVKSQPVDDIQATGGIDFGFDDYCSFALILWSKKTHEKYLWGEFKNHGINTQEFVGVVKSQLARLEATFPFIPNFKRSVKENDADWTHLPYSIHCDTEGLGKQLAYDLQTIYKMNVQPAYQGQQDMQVTNLQGEVQREWFKCRVAQNGLNSQFHEESSRTVFARTKDTDELTRLIDHETFHPELLKSVLYGIRTVWVRKPGELS